MEEAINRHTGELSRKKLIVLLALTWFFGALILLVKTEPTVVTKTQVKEVIRYVPKTVIKEVPATGEATLDDSNWRRLKALDDEIFSVSGDALSSCSNIIQAAGQGDIDTIESENAVMSKQTLDLQSKLEKRKSLIQKLGY